MKKENKIKNILKVNRISYKEAREMFGITRYKIEQDDVSDYDIRLIYEFIDKERD